MSKPRPASTIEDLDRILAWGRDFYAYGPWAGRVDFVEEDLRRTLATMIESEDSAIFIDRDGMCGGLIYPMYFNFGHRIAQELFWWSRGHGRAVREAFEAWAIRRGADAVQMSCLADDREPAMRRLFRSKGYRPIETALYREIEPEIKEEAA